MAGYFEHGLVPFGDNGGSYMICFDYRTNRTTDDPPIVIRSHDMGLEHRVVFIANNVEDSVNVLHGPEDKWNVRVWGAPSSAH